MADFRGKGAHASARLVDRVAIVTGAGGGIGRAHALALARHGVRVVVNDHGGAVDGSGADASAADQVVEEIVAAGGEAVADHRDVGRWDTGAALVAGAVETFGDLDIVVNNAGILRPKTLVGMSEEDVTSVLRVHLLGSFATAHFAALHWRERFKAHGATGGRLINTTSGAGLYGAGQANYAAAKAGIAALTIVAAEELGRYGATVNAISPIALTRMSIGIAPAGFSADPVSALVCWLASPAAHAVTGRVFNVGGEHISLVDRWHSGPSVNSRTPWTLEALDAAMPRLIANAAPHPDASGYYPDEERPEGVPFIAMPRGERAEPGGAS